MTDFYTQYHGLSQLTFSAWQHYSHSIVDRLRFYLSYLKDVVPTEITVHWIPQDLQLYDIQESESGRVERMEIRLLYEQKIFMTCVVSMEHDSAPPEGTGGFLAYNNWLRGECVHDHLQAWGMFTALREMRFCTSQHGLTWDRTATYHPMNDVWEVVAYLRREFERVLICALIEQEQN